MSADNVTPIRDAWNTLADLEGVFHDALDDVPADEPGYSQTAETRQDLTRVADLLRESIMALRGCATREGPLYREYCERVPANQRP